jgi:hypothetical protein
MDRVCAMKRSSDRTLGDMTRTTAIFLCALSFAVASSSGSVGHAQSPGGSSAEEPELAISMAQLQYFAHKLALSVEARNAELAGFYLHEVEEVAGAIRDGVPEYDGFPIGPLVGAMLMPHLERLEEALENPGWDAVEQTLGLVVDGCNACHQATDHGFIVIEREPGANPYMQSFQPAQ